MQQPGKYTSVPAEASPHVLYALCGLFRRSFHTHVKSSFSSIPGAPVKLRAGQLLVEIYTVAELWRNYPRVVCNWGVTYIR